MPNIKRTWLSLPSLYLGLLLLWSSHSAAQLRPFEASYSSQWDVGISLSGQAKRSLTINSDGSLRLTTNASAMVASLTESSLFNYQDGDITPHHYQYQRKLLNKTRDVQVAFDWTKQQATNTAQGKAWNMPIVPHTLDKQSVQLRLQLDLQAHPNETAYAYDVADGGHLKTYRFIADGEDHIDTPLGQYNAIRIKRDRGTDSDRQTWIWFAPALDYSIVRIVQQEADGKRYQLNLKQLTWLDG
ncbi:MAG: DUF3108 domain-containing protein [Oceanospirillaceae bacterium]|mgnify:CR=1 FL=1|nr:DUF3108 domain-containing protein [Oceanospirillaceae bacterium]MBT6077249.1 DUF3108 domain-containing protein [Oceanospirillaceae bacterium]